MVEFVSFTKESGVIISGSTDETIRRWSTAPIKRISELSQRCEGKAIKILLANDGQKVVASYEDGTLLQRDLKNGMTIGKLMKGRLGDVVDVAINERCGWILAAYTKFKSENEVILWDLSSCEMVRKPIMVNYGGELTCAALSSNRKMIVTGSRDGTLQRYCAVTGDAKGKPMRGHKGWVRCVAFSPNDEVIVSGSDDKSIIRWVTTNGEQIENPLLHHEEVHCFSISGDGKVIVSFSALHGLCRWDTISGQVIGKSTSKLPRVRDIWTNYDGTKIVTWGSYATIRWWSVESQGVIRESSMVPLSNDVVEYAIDMNHSITAVRLNNGAVAFCDIQW